MKKNLKVLMLTIGTSGDIYPFLGISLGLKKMGYSVTFLSNEHFQHLAEQVNIDFHSIGSEDEYMSVFNNPKVWDKNYGFRILWQKVEPTIDRVYQYVKTQITNNECIIFAHPATVPSARIVKEKFDNIKLITVYLAPANIRTYIDPGVIGPIKISENTPMQKINQTWNSIDQSMLDPVTLPGLNAIRKKLELPSIQHFRSHLQEGADLSLTLFPEWFSKFQADWPDNLVEGDFILYDPNTGGSVPADVKKFINEGEPPIVFTHGSAMRFATIFFQVSLETCIRLGKRAIFISGIQEQIPETLPDTILYCKYIPFSSLLSRAAGLVQHGGIGTTAAAMKAGIPQIIVPMAFDQFHTGFRIEKLGLGFSIDQKNYDVTNMTSMLETLFNSKIIRSNCKKVANYFQPNPIKRVCQRLEEEISRLT